MTTGTTHDLTHAYGLDHFVHDVEAILDRHPALPVTVKEVSDRLLRLVQDGSWLPERARQPREDCYARHLLHKDRCNRFVVLALVWLPGQGTPIHDHSCWGSMGLLENSLREVGFERMDDGSRPGYAELRELNGRQVSERSLSYLLPPYQEIHSIHNNTDRTTVSVHIYGRDIDEVNVFEPESRTVRPMRIKYLQRGVRRRRLRDLSVRPTLTGAVPAASANRGSRACPGPPRACIAGARRAARGRTGRRLRVGRAASARVRGRRGPGGTGPCRS